MNGRTARLSVGAAGLVVLWIVTYWWMDPAPTISFDENGTSSSDRVAPPVTRSDGSADVELSSVSDGVAVPIGIQPAKSITQHETVASPEIKSRQGPRRPVAKKEPRLYTIRPGDLLSRIAQREYGSIRYTTFLFEHNRERLGLSSPDAIREGQVLEIPPLDGSQATGGGGD